MSDRYIVHYLVNSILTCSLENLTAEDAYKNAIPTEALLPIEGNRWHVLMKYPTILSFPGLHPGSRIRVAYQEPSPNPEAETEEMFIEKM